MCSKDSVWLGGYKRDGEWVYNVNDQQSNLTFNNWKIGYPTDDKDKSCITLTTLKGPPPTTLLSYNDWMKKNDAIMWLNEKCDSDYVCTKTHFIIHNIIKLQTNRQSMKK